MKKNTKVNTLVHIVIPIYLYSILINYIWEMLHMSLFVGLPIKELSSWLICLLAFMGFLITWIFEVHAIYKNRWQIMESIISKQLYL